MVRQMIPCIYLRGDKTTDADTLAAEAALKYRDHMADAILVYDFSKGDEAHEQVILTIRKICESCELPVMAGGNVARLEDVKKLIYAGCSNVIVDVSDGSGAELLSEASKRFGREKITAGITSPEEFRLQQKTIEEFSCQLLLFEPAHAEIREIGLVSGIPVIVLSGKDSSEHAVSILKEENVCGYTGAVFADPEFDFLSFKESCEEAGIEVKRDRSEIDWADFKLNSDGLIPVIVQDYKTEEVLMLAYMNKEAFDQTIRTGRMTYWSRSRSELWVKGLTSGHFQYVKELRLDCDNDTILAKVDQIGAACHTGSRSCFFKKLLKKEYDDTNPLKVFQEVYDVILDRREHPKEGSYTNYLFDKGIDKILKKVGEECTEIVIAAKNPDKEEIKYEISDFLYHVMVLMAVKGLTWEEVTRELARR